MQANGQGQRVRIYFDEDDTVHGQPLGTALLERLRRAGCSGATIFRGVAGFGMHEEEIRSVYLEVLSTDLPLVLEWVDQPQRVEQLLPELVTMVGDRLITVEPVTVVQYSRRRAGSVSKRRRVAEIMTRDPVAVSPETPLQELVQLLVGRDYRALPVVDAEWRVVGIVTNGDLVERGGVPRLELLEALSPEARAAELETMERAGRITADVMTRDLVTVRPDTDLATAAHLMVTKQLKRLPVVEASGRLAGVVSRHDILHSLSDGYPAIGQVGARTAAAVSATRVEDVMSREAPRLSADAGLSEVLDVITSTALDCAVVVDRDNRPLGLVTGAEVLRRLSPADQPGLARVLMSRLLPGSRSAEQRAALQPATGHRARDLMITPLATAALEEAITSTARRMLAEHWTVLPVVDAAGRLAGIVERDELLRAVLRSAPGDRLRQS